ncbi:MAG TPA: alkaline phosphatase family protein [Vicinamibacteria bacterium]|nr:alkaline phosphatase family protein [Vicinamibacteria bacterium]
MYSKPHVLFAAVAALAGGSWSCRDAPPFVAVFCLDGASGDIIDELRSHQRVPAFERLIDDGVYGPMQSLAERRIMAAEPRRGYWSPILWASVATGVVAERHGVRDFLLPKPGTSVVWMGSEDDPPVAELNLPEIRGSGPFLMRLRLRSYESNGTQNIGIRFNGEPLGNLTVPVEWQEFQVAVATERLRPARNEVVFELTRQSRPSDVTSGRTKDHRLLSAQLARLEVLDVEGRSVLELDPAFARFDLGRGFYKPEGPVVEAQSAHLRSRPVWTLAGDEGHPVGIVGYWGTWPAYPVNGYLVSSRMGLRGRRVNTTSDLTWPPELVSEIEPLYPSLEEMEPVFSSLHLLDCDPPLIEDRAAIPGVLRQDELYVRAARKLLPSMSSGLFMVYFESLDVLSHAYLSWKHGAEMRPGCRESARRIVDSTYELVDRWLGELIALLPEHATIVVISDHGLVPAELGGLHSPEGIFIASGAGIRQDRAFHGASVLDVAPTLLHLLSSPVPLAMDGKVLAQIFEPETLERAPPRYVDSEIDFDVGTEASSEGQDDVLERLRSIGYIH